MSEEPTDTFYPTEFIEISSGSGHIGRFYWSNQMRLTIEAWGKDGYYESWTNELHGSCALISTVGDWWAWLWT